MKLLKITRNDFLHIAKYLPKHIQWSICVTTASTACNRIDKLSKKHLISKPFSPTADISRALYLSRPLCPYLATLQHDTRLYLEWPKHSANQCCPRFIDAARLKILSRRHGVGNRLFLQVKSSLKIVLIDESNVHMNVLYIYDLFVRIHCIFMKREACKPRIPASAGR